MPPTANIVKAVYLNNRLWPEVDTTTISGTVRSWGVAPSSLQFQVNRHFDTDADTLGNQHAVKIRHLDNVKLVIVPARVFYGVDFNGVFPEIYDGSGSLEKPADTWVNGVAGTLDEYLYWQGIYVDPALAFQNAADHQYNESFTVTCYDYRWCLNRCLFRTPPITRLVNSAGSGVTDQWDRYGNDGDIMGGDGTRIFGASEQCGYEFTYNAYIPSCPSKTPGKSIVVIIEHILRSAFDRYQIVDGKDTGCAWWHLPAISTSCQNRGARPSMCAWPACALTMTAHRLSPSRWLIAPARLRAITPRSLSSQIPRPGRP
jgi:hypothetical protein